MYIEKLEINEKIWMWHREHDGKEDTLTIPLSRSAWCVLSGCFLFVVVEVFVVQVHYRIFLGNFLHFCLPPTFSKKSWSNCDSISFQFSKRYTKEKVVWASNEKNILKVNIPTYEGCHWLLRKRNFDACVVVCLFRYFASRPRAFFWSSPKLMHWHREG